ncbi:MAG: hypothetical protein UT18_C0027G0005 [candidate division CPR2 bacterium GW2011_GWC2_39_10]|uniref:Uncharacterized protein n=1 Tax=candidate division CPR2 bacterium GW2011_GWC2_39_10 TaxID=1618345 RepID=A0A0G0LPZ4_UNCC2|nr:MAG: hypothetical protein UT18_C0027G0005 [candidate division CPR2 bacterium GW2011_GWC2_39_10]
MSKEPLLKKIVEGIKTIWLISGTILNLRDLKQKTTNKNTSRDVIPGLNRNPESLVSPVKTGFQIKFGMTRKGSKFKIPNSIFSFLRNSKSKIPIQNSKFHTLNSGFQAGFLKSATYGFNLTRLFIMEIRYYLHIRFRKIHDNQFAKKKTYYTYYSRPYARSINKASVYAFCISFVAFMALQFISPFNFSGKPRMAEAGSNTVQWTTKGDFENNAGTTNDGNTVISQLDTSISGGNVKVAQGPSLDIGNGNDCDVIIASGFSPTIEQIYENATVNGVTLSNCADSGKNGSNKGLNYGNTYLTAADKVPNFYSLLIQGTLTTTGPSGATQGVKIDFKVKTLMTIENGGMIDANGKGYEGANNTHMNGYGYGTGFGVAGSCWYGHNGGNGGGAGYGGAGGAGGGTYGGAGGGTYGGDYPNNVYSGSGGGAGMNNCQTGFLGNGGNGGGIIKFQANQLENKCLLTKFAGGVY